jgi:hypothetical protein
MQCMCKYCPRPLGADHVPVPQEQAWRALKGMRRSLRSWLTYRKRMDEYAAGQVGPAAIRRPGVRPLPAGAVAATLRSERFATEQDLANKLYALLIEAGVTELPAPDVEADPNVAVKLATIAITGPIATSPEAQGIIWFVAIPVVGVVLVLTQLIRSKADVAKEQERIRCIQSGACTDYGFWMKAASVIAIGYLGMKMFPELRRAVGLRPVPT